MPDQPTVRVGQEWADNDPRQKGQRLLKVLRLDEESQRVWRPHRAAYETVTTAYAVVRRLAPSGGLIGPYRRIRLDRFKPTSTGYRLVEDVPAEVKT